MDIRSTQETVQSAGGVVLCGGEAAPKVALVKRHDGGWVLPKGHVQDGESLAEAALREVEEETGLARESLRIYGYLGGFPFRDFPSDPRPKVNHFFVMGLTGSENDILHTDDFHSDAAWHPLPLRVPLKYAYQQRVLSGAQNAYIGHAKEAEEQAGNKEGKASHR